MGINLNFQSKNLDSDKSYELSAIVGNGSFFYALFDYGQQLVQSNFMEYYSYGMESAHVIIGEILEKENINIDKLRKVKIGILNNECTVIPRTIYDPKQKSIYLKNLISIDKVGSGVYSDYSSEYVFVYQADINLIESLKYLFEDPRIYHLEKALVDLEVIGNKSGIFTHFIDDEIQIQHITDQKLQLTASYQIPSPLGGLYYLMLLLENHELDPKKVPVYISGHLEVNSDLVSLFKRYILQVQFIDCPVHFDNYSDFPSHYFYPLYCVSQCA